MRTSPALMLAGVLLAAPLAAQAPREKVVFAPEKDAMLDAIRAETGRKPEQPAKNQMWVDFGAIDAPKGAGEFRSAWHQPPVRQGVSGMCWCFSTTSFFESEIKRLSGRELKLSELHTIYWEYVEKARGFVRSRGKSVFGQGSEGNAVRRVWRAHGVVPAAAYTGLPEGRKEHNHEALFRELKAYLDGVKAAGAWNEDLVAATVRAILDAHLGAPPAAVAVEGRSLTPRQYLEQIVRLNLDDYVDILSLMEKPLHARVEYEVPDNWWHDKDYLNVSLEEFMGAFKGALRKGYSVAIGGDMSEPGYAIGAPGIAVVPSFDIPPEAITEAARQFRFSNGSTTDDHGLHVVGFLEKGGLDWFLVKDSWSSAWNNAHPGYYFYREDYVKLKVMDFMVHRDAVKELLAKAK